jgi:uncharacterized protein (TIGR02147 family)
MLTVCHTYRYVGPMEYLHTLEQYFKGKKSKNPAYSLRAYARDLGLHPSTLSKVLKGTRNLPFTNLENVASRLDLSHEEKENFFSSVLQTRGFGQAETGVWPLKQIKFLKNDIHFQIISEWEHYAFLNLLKLKKFRNDIDWICAALEISSKRCRKVIENLTKAEMITKNSENQFVRQFPKIHSSDEVSSAALRVAHQNDLKIAAPKLWSTPIEERDFYSIVMPISTKKLKKAKQLTRSYFKQMETLLETSDSDEVYQLAVQLFPLTSTKKKTMRKLS